MDEIHDLIETIDIKLGLMDFIDTNKFRPWDKMILLETFLRLNFFDMSADLL